MSILDFRDELAAEEARCNALKWGDSEGMLAYKDKLATQIAEREVELNRQREQDRASRYSQQIPRPSSNF
jgi:hypothetical protein